MYYLKFLIIYAAFAFILHLVPVGSGIKIADLPFAGIDPEHLIHVAIFLPWMVLVWIYVNKNKLTGTTRFNTIIVWFFAGVLLAVIAEGTQYFIPYRSFNLIDAGFSVLGIILGATIFFIKKKPHTNSRQKFPVNCY